MPHQQQEVVVMPSKYCEFKNFKPSQKTVDALEQIERKMKLSKALEVFAWAGTLMNLFAGKGTKLPSGGGHAFNIGTYNWEVFAGAIGGIGGIQQHYIMQVVELAIMDTTGEDKKFWRCMKNALNN